jgi:serine/threonine protein kinase
MNISPTQVPVLLQEEYSELVGCTLVVEKQFNAGEDRLSNAFLVSVSKPGTTSYTFVAKAAAPHDENGQSLMDEWEALRLMRGSGKPSSTLLFPEHRPAHFLLIEYIAGADAKTLLNSGSDPAVIFRLIGKATGAVHGTLVPSTDPILGISSEEWQKHVTQKILKNLAATRQLITDDVYEMSEGLVRRSLPLLDLESDQPTILIHRDIYSSNFIISDDLQNVTLIDFGMARGGRPLYDFAKLYILDLYHYPANRNDFLEGYKESSPLPMDYNVLMQPYVLRELLGMIPFFDRVGHSEAKKHAITILDTFCRNNGSIDALLQGAS